MSGDWGYRDRMIGESVLLSCLAKNSTEEEELVCGCPHTCKANLIRWQRTRFLNEKEEVENTLNY